MRLARAALRRFLGLPAPRSRTSCSEEWVAMRDGTRLATHVVSPVDLDAAVPCVLVRSDEPVPATASTLLAERGYVVIVQRCRGRLGSEGRFTPFADEGNDGADTLDWIAKQPWFGGRLALAGFGYAGQTAWMALGHRPEAVNALVVGFAGREPYRSLYAGGALQLEWALHFAVRLASEDGQGDGWRAARSRPVRKADRVALRQLDWYRDWVDHPAPDDYWENLTPPLPAAPPPALLVAGLHHPTLGAQLSDYRALVRAHAAPDLVLGPWSARPLPRGERSSRARLAPTAMRAMVDFLGRRLEADGDVSTRSRVFVSPGDHWRESTSWPPEDSGERLLYLQGGDDGGRLLEEPPAPGAPPAHFVYDPADATPAAGGTSLDHPSARRPAALGRRGDALRFRSDPLPADLEVVGPVCVVLFAATDAPDTDFVARLLEVDAAGNARSLCEGVVRARRAREEGDWQDGTPSRYEIDLWAAARRLRAGSRITLEIGSSSFPRFDRNPNTRTEPAAAEDADGVPARQTIHQDAEHASLLRLSVATR